MTASEKPKSSIPKWAIASVAGIAVLVVSLIMFFPKDLNDVSSSEPTKVKTDGESQQSTSPEAKPIERVPGAKAPDISIHIAARKGNIEAVKQHLVAGTDVKSRDKHGGTPLHFSATFGHKKICELLIAKGADINAKNASNKTPVNAASDFKHTETVELLRKHGGKTGEELKAEGN